MTHALTVLVAEDNILVGLDLKMALESLDCEVWGPFATVADSLEAIVDKVPDYALLDVELKDGRAFTVAKQLDISQTPYVFVTGRGDLLEEAGFEGHDLIPKPFEIEELEPRIAKIIAQKNS